MSSLSNPHRGCDPSQKRRAVPSRPTRPGPRQEGAIAMTRLVAAIDGVIGVDTHHDTLAAAVTHMVGGLLAQTAVRADAAGYRQLFDSPEDQVSGRRCWAVEGAGSYGAGLAAFLQARGERGGGGRQGLRHHPGQGADRQGARGAAGRVGAGRPPNGRSCAAPGCGIGRPGRWSIARPSGRCAPRRAASSSSPPRLPSCGPSGNGWWRR
jgi:hypothetical protein